MINDNKFYEYAKIFGNYYGTLKKNVDRSFINYDIIFDIDWQGTKQLSEFKNLNLNYRPSELNKEFYYKAAVIFERG